MVSLLRNFIKVSGLLFLLRLMISAFSKILTKLSIFYNFLNWATYPETEFQDHFCDLANLFNNGKVHFLERGFFNNYFIKKNANVLEFCSGDGFYTSMFYSQKAKKVVAVDYSASAVSFSKRWNAKSNILYIQKNLLELDTFKENEFSALYDNIIFDACIDRFDVAEFGNILEFIKGRLEKNGYLTGYVTQGNYHLTKNPIKSKEQLAELFNPFFMNVEVYSSVYDDRVNLYFKVTGKK